MSTQAARTYSPEEYLELDRASEQKSEYRDGQVVAMTGASMRHNLIVANLIRHLGNALDGGRVICH